MKEIKYLRERKEAMKLIAGGAIAAGVPLTATGFLWGKSSSNPAETVESLITLPDSSENLQKMTSFDQAFADARELQGPGGLFNWNGKAYNTFYKEEWDNMSSFDKNEYFSSVGLNNIVKASPAGDIQYTQTFGANLSSDQDIPLNDFVDYDPELDQELADFSLEVDSLDSYEDNAENTVEGGFAMGTNKFNDDSGFNPTNSRTKNHDVDEFDFGDEGSNNTGYADTHEEENDEFDFGDDQENHNDVAYEDKASKDIEEFEFEDESEFSNGGGDIIEFE